MSNKKRVTITTPVGIAFWPKTEKGKPDVFKPKEGGEKIRYTVNFGFNSDAELAKFQADVDALIEKNGLDTGKNSQTPYKTDKKTEQVTVFTYSGASLTDPKKDYCPPKFDSRNKRLPADFVLRGGSKIRLDLTVNAYTGMGGGVGFYINGIQVLEAAEGYTPGFEAVEDGFNYEGESGDNSAPGGFGSHSEATATTSDDEIPF